ncbi:MAG: substrate-binding domain-containing protein [Synergistaceae bacterium]|jgi:LacI family transcriptional regulator|nr:substrate-binding domain-containing protein [Synergistaceae bacterium]
MNKRATLRDIAKKAGVSAVTVHKVIYSKDGVGEETRKRILRIAGDMNYSVNLAASSLKRKAIHIAVIFRAKSTPQNFFFQKMWDGIDKAERALWDYRVRITRMECDDRWESQDAILRSLADRADVDGVILHCWDETRLNPAIDYLFGRGVPLVTANSDAPASKRVACVSAPNERVGSLAAETLSLLVPDGCLAIVAGGIKPAENLHANRRGFSSFMRLRLPHVSIPEIYNTGDRDKFRNELKDTLQSASDVCGIYAITARDTLNVCEIIRETGMSGEIKVVGSDVFEEMEPFFDDGTLHASIWKDQQSQAERAVILLYQYLSGQEVQVEPIRLGIIMKNNIEDYL